MIDSRRTIQSSIALGAAVCVLGCAAQNPGAADLSLVEPLGRYAMTDAGEHMMAWPGSGLRFAYEGGSVSVEIDDDGRGFMDVIVNGNHRVLDLEPGRNHYRLVDAESGTHDVQITRRSEFYDTGGFTISPPEFDGQAVLKPVFQSGREILFVGDSITAGFGVGGDTKDCANTPTLHSPTESYAMMTADIFDAEPHLIAISGRGVIYNWDNNPAPVMPTQIDFALPDDKTVVWDHSDFTPDVVVTLLGTNDWSVINPGRMKFRQGYSDMLLDLRKRHPDAHIVTVSGPLLGGEQGAAIRDSIDWAMDNLMDPNISTLDLDLSHTGLRWSCNSHPGRESMRAMTRELSEHIARKTGWDFKSALPAIAPPDLPPGGLQHFAKRVAEIDAAPRIDGGVMLVGDSITEAWAWQDGVFPVTPVSNHGVGWDSTEGTLARLPQMARDNPDAILVKIGTNDISLGVPKAQMYKNLDALLGELTSEHPDADVMLQAILPREADRMAEVTDINAQYKKIATQHGVAWLDFTDAFADTSGQLKPELTDDQLHLNAQGYALWADQLRPYLQ